MDKKENQPREKKGMPLAPVFLLGATVLLLIEMYFIVNLPRVYLVQIILGAAILACTYVFIAALLKEIHKTGEQVKDEYERMLRGEKASYLMLKKISEQLEAVDRNTREPGEEIITAQKAIAKVTITRSKENADALMNSNDRVVDNLLQLKESMDAGFEQFAGKQQNMMDDSVKELVLKQQEFAEKLKEITAGLKEITEGLQAVKETVAEEKAQTLAAIESRMDELVSQNAALESKIAESTAAAAAQKPDMEAEPELVMEPQPEEVMEPQPEVLTESEPDMEAEPELVMEPQPEEVMEPEADFSMPDTPEEELPVVDAETVTDDTPVMEEYEEPIVDSDAIVEEEDAAAATDDQNEAEAESGEIDSFDFGADGLDFGGDSLDLGVDGLDLGTENLDLGADNLDAGAGGTEAQDWAEMLYRMYNRWAERHNSTAELLDYLHGHEAGLKSASIMISGDNAYGFLKSESGVHRLVRVSPFDSSGRRHTSFAALEVMPEIDDSMEVDIRPEDIKMDVFRASCAGGQHINKTSSAVRLTHLPTGIVVSCQTQRSQYQNKDYAMKMLRAKLVEIKEREHLDKIADIKGVQKEIAWGAQIRSYVFMPYTLVKDHRTGFENGNIQAVMDGDLDGFINAYLKALSSGTLQK